MRLSLIFILFSLFNHQTFSQDLYMPRDIRQAFENETRSMDGNPGKRYWQNHARYIIDITALPPDRTIKGHERITYFNNSPDSLEHINIKLFLNVHKPGAPRNFGASPDYLTSGMTITHFTINDEPKEFPERPNTFTNAGLTLADRLAPHDSIQLTFDWEYTISLQSGREGMIDSTTYFLAYFYPRIAVYDDYHGWDRIPFMDSHEFYSDFNDYEVTLHVPGSFIVWGTGTLQNPEEVLQPATLQRFKDSFTSDAIIQIATLEQIQSGSVTKQAATNTWKFTARDISDMAFGLSDHYVWNAGSVLVDPTTGRRASVQSAAYDSAADYRHMVSFGKHALQWFSRNWPGVPYPYEKSTIFQGYADMEYPMMVNDQSMEDTTFAKFVAEHEIAHTYMPFYMGINETRYGFMDEGWATTLELLIGRSDLGVEQAERLFRIFRVNSWIHDADAAEDIPIITPADALTGPGFGNNEYGKAALGYLAVKDLLGDSLFRKCLHAYMQRWHGKHPVPWDFFNTFNDVSHENLNWIWTNWFFTHSYIDFALRDVKKKGRSYQISIENVGGFFAPADVVVNYADGSQELSHVSPRVWQKDAHRARIKVKVKKKVVSVAIDGGIFMDASPADNVRHL